MRIAIVGAGPAGATAALALSRQGTHEIVLLDRDSFPRVKTCGSALSPRCISLCHTLGIETTMAPLAYPVSGLRFTGPSGRQATLTGKAGGAWIIPRARFDAEIAFAAERFGVRFEQGFKATTLVRDPRGRVAGVSDGQRTLEADLTLVADGAHSRFSSDLRKKRQIATLMGWWEGVEGVLPGHMEMWFDRRVAPWYGWLFPETTERVNIGIYYRPEDPVPPKDIFGEIVDRHLGRRLRKATQVQKYRGAPIVYTEEIGEVAAPGALWIGEAARLTNAATGEGIFYAMKSGVIAAELIARHGITDGDRLLTAYRTAIQRAFTARFLLALGFMRFANTPAFSLLTSLVAVPPVQKTLTWALEHV